MKDDTITNHLEAAHSNLVQAAKIAHLERLRDAENLSRLIDNLEDLIEQFDS